MIKLILTIVLLLTFGSAAFANDKSCSSRLFYIAKSTNHNIVAYDANVTSQGTLNVDEPLEIYWSRINSTSRIALSWLEETFAYGVDYLSETKGLKYLFCITSVPDKKVELTMENGCPKALMVINGEPAVLTKVYVNLTGSGLSSDVKYIEVSGISQTTGSQLTERIDKN